MHSKVQRRGSSKSSFSICSVSSRSRLYSKSVRNGCKRRQKRQVVATQIHVYQDTSCKHLKGLRPQEVAPPRVGGCVQILRRSDPADKRQRTITTIPARSMLELAYPASEPHARQSAHPECLRTTSLISKTPIALIIAVWVTSALVTSVPQPYKIEKIERGSRKQHGQFANTTERSCAVRFNRDHSHRRAGRAAAMQLNVRSRLHDQNNTSGLERPMNCAISPSQKNTGKRERRRSSWGKIPSLPHHRFTNDGNDSFQETTKRHRLAANGDHEFVLQTCIVSCDAETHSI